ncbi:MAG UNVERIFIED_CONTAM: transposase [Planctomycetaceae bacterium]
MKAIFWDGDGFVIWYKRLERGTWQLPAADPESLEFEAHELAMILRGIDLKSAQLHVHNHHRK